MKISIISGSHRKSSQSEKVARFIQQTLEDESICDQTWLFRLAENPLPLWDESIWEGKADWKQKLDPISGELASSDGFVVISPEWHGQAPSG